jgi:glycerol dehydrogenase-like iron-containing ADH family enzyme
MSTPEPYDPASIFWPVSAYGTITPRVFISPQRYVQGPGVIDNIDRNLTLVQISRLAILISDRERANEGARPLSSLESEHIEAVLCRFGGETSLEEIDLRRAELDGRVDCLMVVGGGKCVDAGKSIAFRLGIPFVIVPTLASTAMGGSATGEICAHTLFEHGVAAASSVRTRNVNASLDAVVEANTLLRGLGFESCGVAIAHGIAQTCTSLPGIPERYHHGEMVAIGTLVQLAPEERRDETAKVSRFFPEVGLPAHEVGDSAYRRLQEG